MDRRIFVYGSLMRGLHNHHHLADARPIGPARLDPAQGYGMISLGMFPAIRPARGAGGPIVGELYGVDGPTSAALDRLEGHPTFYARTWVETIDDGPCWAYVLARGDRARSGPDVPGGDWRAYLIANQEGV